MLHNLFFLLFQHVDPRVYPPQVMSLIEKHILFLIDRESAEGRCVRDVVNYPNWIYGASNLSRQASAKDVSCQGVLNCGIRDLCAKLMLS